MLLLIHITCALSSIVATFVSLIMPSKQKINTSYGLVTATIASGTYLVLSTHASLVGACVSGLVFLGFCFSGLYMARYRMATQLANRKR